MEDNRDAKTKRVQLVARNFVGGLRTFMRAYMLKWWVATILSGSCPSIVKTGRELEEGDVTEYHGCVAHHLKLTAEKGLFAAHVQASCLTWYHKAVTRYSSSSQAPGRLLIDCAAKEQALSSRQVLKYAVTI